LSPTRRADHPAKRTLRKAAAECGLLSRHRERPIGLEWTLTRHGGRYRLIDLSIDRFSQVLALRSPIGDMLIHSHGDVPAVLGWMREKSARLIG
jgi:hypothetical protein